MSHSPEDRSAQPVDERVQALAEKAHGRSSDNDELNDDELFAELDKDEEQTLAAFREQRMEQLKQELNRTREMRQQGHGEYSEATSDKDILKITTTIKYCVVHFYHKEFRRCQIIDKHLSILARKHFNTKFVKVNVENAPFLVDKLKVQVLPCVISFIDGVSVDRLVGFDELGNTDSFTTAALELRLSLHGAIPKPKQKEEEPPKTIFGFAGGNDDDDDDDD